MGVKVLLTVLKKLFVQPGSGRRASALYRGLDHRARRLVPDVLQLLEREGFATATKLGENFVWLPVRSQGKRVREMLSAPSGSKDPVLRQAAEVD